MRYKLDNAGYVCAVSFGCYLDNCTEYTGAVPTGYNNLDEWATYACIQAYYIYNGNLVLDSERLTECQNKQVQEAIDNAPLYRKDLYENDEVLDSQYIRKTATGHVITLKDIKTIAPRLKLIGIHPEWYSKFKVITQGKNMMPFTGKTETIAGVSFINNQNGSITITGKATSNIEYIISECDFTLKPDEKYHLNLGGFDCEFRFNNNGAIAQQYIGTSGVINVPKNIEVSQVILKVASGQTVNSTFYPQLEYGESFTSYESYKCKTLEIDMGDYNALSPSNSLYPSNSLFPSGGNVIDYVLIENGTITMSVNGVPKLLASGAVGLFGDYTTIYSNKYLYMVLEYSSSLLDVGSLEFLQGKSTTTNQFKILKDGSIEAHNGYFSGRIEADSGYFKGEISWDQVTGNEGVATKSYVEGMGYQTATQVTKITKDTVTTSFVNALKVKAGSVDAENITGTTIKGKKLEGVTGEIGGFAIGNNSLHAGTKTSFSSNLDGVYVGTDGIAVGAYAFKVTADGDIYLGYQNDIITHGGIDFKALSYAKIKYDGNELMAFSQYDTTFSRDVVLSKSDLTLNGGDLVTAGATTYIRGSVATNYHIKFETSRLSLVNTCNVIGKSDSKVGFFGNDGSAKKTVSTVSTSATASTIATKLNELINALKAYNLIG